MRITVTALFVCLATVAQWMSGTSAVPYDPLKEVKKGVEKGIDITKEAGNLAPSVEDIAKAGKELAFGTPVKVILEGINKFCSLALATEGDVERTRDVIPNLGDVSLKLMDGRFNRSFNVESVREMVNMETFNKNNPTVVLTTGWLSIRENKTNLSAEKILSAYQCRGGYNFIVSRGELHVKHTREEEKLCDSGRGSEVV